MNKKENGFQKLALNKLLFRLYAIKSIPMVFLAGIKIKKLSSSASEVTISYGYLTKNPFKSLYFACQAMAAELSTGALAMMAIHDKKPPVSMLVANMKAEFTKKAIGKITFTCDEGEKIVEAVNSTIKTGEGVTVQVKSTGTDEHGNIVATFFFTWTFKQRKK